MGLFGLVETVGCGQLMGPADTWQPRSGKTQKNCAPWTKSVFKCRPTRWVARELYRPMAHKGPIGNPPRRPGGPKGFSDLGEIPVKPSPERDWGEIGTPKGFLGTTQTIPLAKNPGKPRGGPIPSQSHVFRAPILGPKRGPGPLGTQAWTWGSKNGVRG